MAKLAGMKLRCRDGHFGWGGWEIRPTRSQGFIAVVPCDLGDHYLWYDEAGVTSEIMPMVYATREAAEDAIARWEQMESEKA